MSDTLKSVLVANTNLIYGAFGGYPHGSTGAVLNTLREVYNVPLSYVEQVTIGHEGELGTVTYANTVVARFKWFEGINHAVMMFTNPKWAGYGKQNHWILVDDRDLTRLKPKFKVTLNMHLMPAFEIHGEMATEQLHTFLDYPMLSDHVRDPTYRLKTDSGAFFQGGAHEPHDKWMMIEFWRSKGVPDWMDYLNEHYIHDPRKWAEDNDPARVL